MSRFSFLRLAALGLSISLGGGVAVAGGTVRIEPNRSYGATVTFEKGVRVYRALPADRYVIINPGHQTPLSLSIQDTRIYENRTIHNHFHDHRRGDRGGRYVTGGYYGGYYGGYGRARGYGGKKYFRRNHRGAGGVRAAP